MNKRLRTIRKLAKEFDREVEYRKGHFFLRHPDKPLVTASGSPRNVDHWIENVRKDLQRKDTRK